MTGRDLQAAVRPLEQWATAISRFSQIAQEAIRLEAGLTLATAQLTETQAALATAKTEVAALRAEAATLTERLGIERQAALQTTHQEQSALVSAARETILRHQAAAEALAEKTRVAAAAHAARLAEWTAKEAAAAERVDILRDLAQRMARAAEAVPR